MAFVQQWDNYLYETEVTYYNYTAAKLWARDRNAYAVVIAAAYVSLVFLGVRWMKDRPAYSLRRTLVLWNVGLAWFSIFATYRISPYVVRRVAEGKWLDIVCNAESFEAEHGGLWSFVFALSKFVEFGDTAFVVLKKKPLSFLHWYHHTTVMLYCWFGFLEPAAPGKTFGLLNAIVHSMMYTYYGLTATGLWRIPRVINVFITSMQLLQMFIGIVATSIAFYMHQHNERCDITSNLMWAAFAMYGSYFVLFLNFFYKTYIRPKPKAKAT